MGHEHNWKQRMALAVLPPVGAVVFRLLGATLRFEEIGEIGAHADDHPETRVYCLWHRSLLSIAYHFRKRNIAILISPSFDGELIAAMIQHVGYTPVRGSSSRGGAAGLLGMQRALDGANETQGNYAGTRCNYAAFTCDGPRGPVYYAKPGGVKLAQQVGGGVGIFYAAPDRAWKLRSWDGFLIPKPFSTVVIAWQPPVPVEGALGEGSRTEGIVEGSPGEEESDGKAWEPARLAVEQALELARYRVEEHIARRRGEPQV